MYSRGIAHRAREVAGDGWPVASEGSVVVACSVCSCVLAVRAEVHRREGPEVGLAVRIYVSHWEGEWTGNGLGCLTRKVPEGIDQRHPMCSPQVTQSSLNVYVPVRLKRRVPICSLASRCMVGRTWL